MRIDLMRHQLLIWMMGVLFAGVACSDAKRTAQDAAGQALLDRSKSLYCDLEQLQSRTDSVWDEVSVALDRNLPQDMRKDHRDNMINLRNTDLVKMFEAYPALDTLVKEKVEKAGQVDQLIAAEVKALRQQIEVQDSAVLAFLGELEQNAPRRYRHWMNVFDGAKKRPCQ